MLAVSRTLGLALVNFGEYHISVVGSFVNLMPGISLLWRKEWSLFLSLLICDHFKAYIL